MREYREYRGQRADNGEWVYGFYFEDMGCFIKEKSSSVSTNTYLVKPETVGQHIDLTDKNAKKIFEGDVVIWCGIKGIVVWEGHKFYIKSNLLWDFSDDDCIEVIGNIHDNSELLKGDAEE